MHQRRTRNTSLNHINGFVVASLFAVLTVTSAMGQVARDTLDVLFVGNSYIYFNNLPALVEGMSEALDGPYIRGAAHTRGGATLQEHLDDGDLSDLLAPGPNGEPAWDWVFIQEQSTLGTAYNRETGVLGSPAAFYVAASELVARIRAAAAQPGLYMTWAKEPFPEHTEILSDAYRALGTALDVPVAAVGEAWAEVRRLQPTLRLYTPDGSHPNATGSYLAAAVIYATITGQSPLGAPRKLTGAPWNNSRVLTSSQPTVLVSLTATDAEFLQRIAWQVVSQ